MKSCRIFTILNVILWFLLITTPSVAQQNPGAGAISTQLNKGFHRQPLVAQTAQGEILSLYKESHALLIGVSEYNQWQDLDSIPDELDDVDGALSEQGFSVERLVNPTGRDLEAGINQFIDRHGFDPENRLLIYFSGHGHSYPNESKAYVVPVDAPLPDDQRDFRRKAVSMDRVMAWARDIESKHVLFVFDSCFAGDLFKSRSMPMENDRYIRKVTAKPVRQFLTAGSAGEEVPAKSTFTPAFVEAIRGEGDTNNDGYVTGTELGVHLSQYIPRFTEQTPQFGPIPDRELSRGDFVFFSGKTEVVPPISGMQATEPTGIIGIEKVLWESAEGDDTESSYASYLERFPEGYFAGIARSRLFQIVKEREQREAEVKAEQDAIREQRRLAAVARVEAAKKLEQSRIEKERQRRATELARQEALLEKERKRQELEKSQQAQQQENEKNARIQRDRLLAEQRREARVAASRKKAELRAALIVERERERLLSELSSPGNENAAEREQGRADEANAKRSDSEAQTLKQARLLRTQIEKNLQDLKLTSPQKDNANTRLNDLEILDPGNRFVQEGRQRIRDFYVAWIEKQVAVESYEKADRYVRSLALVENSENEIQEMEALIADALAESKVITANQQPIQTPTGTKTSVEPTVVAPDVAKNRFLPEMVYIEGGQFDMGSSNGDSDERPVHRVSLKSFHISKFEITYEQYDYFVRKTKRKMPASLLSQRGKKPVIGINFAEAEAFTRWLTKETGESYGLPTEAEWEYAARAGTTGDYSFGAKNKICDYANGSDRHTKCNDGSRKTVDVGTYKSNPWGLYDMHGNVAEWTRDCWFDNYKNASSTGVPRKATNCTNRAVRGGGWNSNLDRLRSSYRFAAGGKSQYPNIGFRVIKR